MALTAQTTLDVVDGTSTITFFQSSSQVDQITYASNTITFQTTTQYNLDKSDYLLWFQYFNVFFTSLGINFPIINASANSAWPLSSFEIQETDVGTEKVIFTQTSLGTTVLNINYVPVAVACTVSARSAITITAQEFFMTLAMLAQFTNQVSVS